MRISDEGRGELKRIAGLHRACADETRLRVLNLLGGAGEICVWELAAVIGTNQPKVSRHLAYLKRVGLVAGRKDGLLVHYRLNERAEGTIARHLESLQSSLKTVAELHEDLRRLAQQRAREAPEVAEVSEAADLEVELL